MRSRIKADQRQIQLTRRKTTLKKAADRVLSIGNVISRKLLAAIGYLSHPTTLKIMFKFARTAYAIYRFVYMLFSVLGNLL